MSETRMRLGMYDMPDVVHLADTFRALGIKWRKVDRDVMHLLHTSNLSVRVGAHANGNSDGYLLNMVKYPSGVGISYIGPESCVGPVRNVIDANLTRC